MKTKVKIPEMSKENIISKKNQQMLISAKPIAEQAGGIIAAEAARFPKSRVPVPLSRAPAHEINSLLGVEPAAETEPKPGSEPESEPGSDSEAEPNLGPNPHPNPRPELNPEYDPEPDSESESGSGSEAEPI